MKDQTEEIKKWLEQNALRLSHQHTQESHIVEMKSWAVPHEIKMAWEAGRACGFHAGLRAGFEQAMEIKVNGVVNE